MLYQCPEGIDRLGGVGANRDQVPVGQEAVDLVGGNSVGVQAVQHDQQVSAEVVRLGHVEIEHGVADGDPVEAEARCQLEQIRHVVAIGEHVDPHPAGADRLIRLVVDLADSACPIGDQDPRLHGP